MSRIRKYPEWICHDCGLKYCANPLGGSRMATFHIDNCQCCGKEDVPCTEPRDYGHFPEWPLPKEVDPKPLPETLSDLIDPVIEFFDIERVHKAMVHLNWWWLTGEGPGKIPTVEQIERQARNLLSRVCDPEKNAIQATGGLEARRLDDGLSIRFVLTESDFYLEDFE